MKLGRRILMTNSALIVGLIVLGAIALLSVSAMRRDLHIASEEYEEIERVAMIEGHVASVLAEASNAPADLDRIRTEIRGAIEKLDMLEQMQEAEGLASHEDEEHAEREGESIAKIAEALEAMQYRIADGDARWGPEESYAISQLALDLLPDLNEFSRVTRRAIRDAERRANDRLRLATIALAVASGVIILIAMLVSRSGYRAVMLPLTRLRRGVERVAEGRFDEPVGADRIDEFNDLAEDFNSMAAQLSDYRDHMEEKVAIKGKELVRSERLASVGFLAAGMAHEINNPLGIISTYAEISLNELKDRDGDPAIDDAKRTLTIVHEEAHRCKAIIQKLLSLSRNGGDKPQSVSLKRVATEIADTLIGLKRYGDRRLELDLPDHDPLCVCANEVEMKQVLLNLVVNALDAVPPEDGVVRIVGRSDGEDVVLEVVDNGRGMEPETIDHVFEPFYTTRDQPGGGIGLGLSICHAIIESHDGCIRAASDGPGRGSRFTVEMPAMQEEAVHDVA